MHDQIFFSRFSGFPWKHRNIFVLRLWALTVLRHSDLMYGFDFRYAANLHFDFDVSKVYFNIRHPVGVESRGRYVYRALCRPDLALARCCTCQI